MPFKSAVACWLGLILYLIPANPFSNLVPIWRQIPPNPSHWWDGCVAAEARGREQRGAFCGAVAGRGVDTLPCWRLDNKTPPGCATNTEQTPNRLCLDPTSCGLYCHENVTAVLCQHPRSNGLRILLRGKSPFKASLELARWSGSGLSTWAAVAFPRSCRGSAPGVAVGLVRPWRLCWPLGQPGKDVLHVPAVLLPPLALCPCPGLQCYRAQSCQQGGKGQVSSAKGERGDLCS